jgi:hypothetical protein
MCEQKELAAFTSVTGALINERETLAGVQTLPELLQ